MLGEIKENARIYVLDTRKRPVLLDGVVVEIQPPKTQFGQPALPGNSMLPAFSDMSIRVDGEVLDFRQVALSKNIMDYGNGWVISNDRDAMYAYIDNLGQVSAARLRNRPVDEEIVAACEEIKPLLNPTIAKERERDKVIDERFSRLESMMQRILERELPSSE